MSVRFRLSPQIGDILLEKVLLFFSRWTLTESFVFFSGIFFTGIYKFISKFLLKQEIYNSVNDNGRIKNILYSLGGNQVKLDASLVLVTRLHNGETWLNGKHRFKLSVQKSLTVFDNQETYLRLKNADISELDEILSRVVKKPYDIISIEELPNDFEFKRVLKRDGFKYLVLFQISKNKTPLGYLWFLFEELAVHDKEVYSEIIKITANIAEEFA